jgi:hypothetical protein
MSMRHLESHRRLVGFKSGGGEYASELVTVLRGDGSTESLQHI